MHSYSYVATVFSMILGLGMTRLLTKSVALFQSEQKLAHHGVRLVWCAAIFVLQLQFWWAAIELDKLEPRWTLGMFLGTLTVPLLLFVATAMLLPEQLPLQKSTDEELEPVARWGLVALSLYAVVAFVLDLTLFRAKAWSSGTYFLGSEMALPLVYLLVKRARTRVIVSVVYLLHVLVGSVRLSPAAY